MHRRFLHTRALLLPALLLGLLSGWQTPPVHGGGPPPQSSVLSPQSLPDQARPDVESDTPRSETIGAAFALLMDQFYRVPDPAALLTAAWEGATGALARAGYLDPLPPPPPLPADREGAWNAFAPAYRALATLAPQELSQTGLAFAAVEAMADSLQERHTGFLSPARYRAFVEQLSGEGTRIGLGVVIAARPPWVVTDVAPGGPAEGAGVRPGDAIVAVDGRDVTRVSRPELLRLLAGPQDSAVDLGLSRPGEGRLTLPVMRGLFRFPDLQARVLPGGSGYVRLRSFSTFLRVPAKEHNVIQELDAALEEFEAAGVTAWVIDLRDNPGGFVFTANELIGRFLPLGVTYAASDQRGNRGEQISSGRPFRVQRPLAVLVNGGSASSAEIFASAMQESGRGVVVGERSAGALAGSVVFPLPEEAGMQVAVEEARTGRRQAAVDEVGIPPDVEVADTRTPSDYAAGRDPQLEAAITAAASSAVPSGPRGGDVGDPAAQRDEGVGPFTGQLSEAALRGLLTPYLPAPEEAPPTPLIRAPRLLGELALTDPTQFVNALGPVRDGLELARTVQGRGWQGSYSRFYGEVPALNGPFLGVTIDLYASQAGADAALNSNDAPQLLRVVAPPLQLGDGAVAYAGAWVNAGGAVIAWRAGRAVVSVAYTAVPGQESFEPAVALARLVDARLRRSPPEFGGPGAGSDLLPTPHSTPGTRS